MQQWFSGFEQQAVQDSDQWDRENKWGESYDYPRLRPEQSFQAAVQGRGTQVESDSHSASKR